MERDERGGFLMKKFIIFLSALLFLATIALYNSFAAAKELTNEDLKKYEASDKGKSGDTTEKQESAPQKTEAAQDAAQDTPKQPDKQYWCTQATRLIAKVDAASKNVDYIEKQRDEAAMPAYPAASGSSVEDKLAQAKQELESAEKELSDFEQLAYSQDIPPGWLRCQFE
jgi:hypothetical protein